MNLIFSLIFFNREESFIILESGDPPEVFPRIKISTQRKTCSPRWPLSWTGCTWQDQTWVQHFWFVPTNSIPVLVMVMLLNLKS